MIILLPKFPHWMDLDYHKNAEISFGTRTLLSTNEKGLAFTFEQA